MQIGVVEQTGDESHGLAHHSVVAPILLFGTLAEIHEAFVGFHQRESCSRSGCSLDFIENAVYTVPSFRLASALVVSQ